VPVVAFNCSKDDAHVAIVEGGAVVDTQPDRIKLAVALDPDEQLVAFHETIRQTLAELNPARTGILLAESNYQAPHSTWYPRIALETMIRLASAAAGIPCHMLNRPAVRGALGITKGNLDKNLAVIGTPVGRYWTTGRGVAAMAAIALESA
jgi:hypothetical protein